MGMETDLARANVRRNREQVRDQTMTADSTFAASTADLANTQWVLYSKYARLHKAYDRAGGENWKENKERAPGWPKTVIAVPVVCATLRELHELRVALRVQPTRVLVCGQPTAPVLASLHLPISRDKKHFDDAAASYILQLDLDGLLAAKQFGEYSALELDRQGSGLARDCRFVFRKVLPAWLHDAGLSVGCSQGAGKTTDAIRWHVLLRSTVALTRPELGALCEILNDHFEAAGLGKPLDLKVGESSRLLFSAEPSFHDGDRWHGPLITNPFGFAEGPDIELPPEVLADIRARVKATSESVTKPKAAKVAGAPKVAGARKGDRVSSDATIAGLLASVAEGSRNDTMCSVQMKLMSRHRQERHLWPKLKEQLRTLLQGHPAFADEEWQTKLGLGNAFDRAWRDGEAKLPAQSPVVPPKAEPSEVVSTRAQRNQAKRDRQYDLMRTIRDEALEYAAELRRSGRTTADLVSASPRPRLR